MAMMMMMIMMDDYNNHNDDDDDDNNNNNNNNNNNIYTDKAGTFESHGHSSKCSIVHCEEYSIKANLREK